MASKIEISCENEACDLTGNIELNININVLDVGGKISVSQPCPKCGGKLGAAGGRYERDPSGILKRIGDYSGKV